MNKHRVHTGSREYEIKDITEVTTGTGLAVHENTAWRKAGKLDDVSWTTQNAFQYFHNAKISPIKNNNQERGCY